MSLMTTEQQHVALRLLEQDVPISTIVDRLGLQDADALYTVMRTGSVKNRVTKATAAFVASLRGRDIPSPLDDAILCMSAAIQGRHGQILEQGCGEGGSAYSVARAFPNCTIHAVDLIEEAVTEASQRYKLPNLNYAQADGYNLTAADNTYDVVFHLNVLEHVPDKEAYLAESLRVLKSDGLLFVSFPSERYWRFWGLPKYLACRLLRRKFETHACDDTLIDRFLATRGIKPVAKMYCGLALPRRLYFYVPERWLTSLGRNLAAIEKTLADVGLIQPMMYVSYVITRDARMQRAFSPNTPTQGKGLVFPLAILALAGYWMASTALLCWEVLSGRKAFFRQE